MKLPCLAAVVLLATAGAHAATPAYRCGEAVYSQTPCPGGRVVDATDTPDAAQQAEAQRAAAGERRRAREMERERIAAEKAARRESQIVSLGPQKAAEPVAGKKPKAKKKKKARASPEHFTAVAPGSGKKASKP